MMDENTKDGDYLNTSLAICVLGLGMVLITGTALGAPTALQFFIIGLLLMLYGAGRLHVWNRSDTR